jgi:hypothetical protein
VIEEQSPCGKRLAKQIEAETHGAIRAVWLLGLEVPPAQSESPKTEAA